MEKIHDTIITLGSNYKAMTTIKDCLDLIEKKYKRENVVASHIIMSKPIDFIYPSEDFANCVVALKTSEDFNAFHDYCLSIECLFGRDEYHKKHYPELINIDIDVILWDKVLLRPEDTERIYYQEGIKEIQKYI